MLACGGTHFPKRAILEPLLARTIRSGRPRAYMVSVILRKRAGFSERLGVLGMVCALSTRVALSGAQLARVETSRNSCRTLL